MKYIFRLAQLPYCDGRATTNTLQQVDVSAQALVETKVPTSMRRGFGFHLHSFPPCDLKYRDLIRSVQVRTSESMKIKKYTHELVSFFCRKDSDMAWLGRFPYTR
jgi:hypothetical protein